MKLLRNLEWLVALLALAAFIFVGRLILSDPGAADKWIIVVATALIALFTVFEALRGTERDLKQHHESSNKLRATARLARRMCDETLRAVERQPHALAWAEAVSRPPGLDRLEARFWEVVLYAAEAGDEGARAVEAFEAFLNAADRINDLAARVRDSNRTWEQRTVQYREAVDFLQTAVRLLEQFAPRGPAEEPVEVRFPPPPPDSATSP